MMVVVMVPVMMMVVVMVVVVMMMMMVGPGLRQAWPKGQGSHNGGGGEFDVGHLGSSWKAPREAFKAARGSIAAEFHPGRKLPKRIKPATEGVFWLLGLPNGIATQSGPSCAVSSS
jgi:hypothetical protein